MLLLFLWLFRPNIYGTHHHTYLQNTQKKWNERAKACERPGEKQNANLGVEVWRKKFKSIKGEETLERIAFLKNTGLAVTTKFHSFLSIIHKPKSYQCLSSRTVQEKQLTDTCQYRSPLWKQQDKNQKDSGRINNKVKDRKLIYPTSHLLYVFTREKCYIVVHKEIFLLLRHEIKLNFLNCIDFQQQTIRNILK